MGLSFHDEDSFVQASIGSLRFAPDANVMPEDGSIGVVDQERRDDDFGIQSSDESNIQMDHGREMNVELPVIEIN